MATIKGVRRVNGGKCLPHGLAQRFARCFGLKHAAQIEGFNNLRNEAALRPFPEPGITAHQLGLLLGAQLIALKGNPLDAGAELVAFKIGRGNGQHGSKGGKADERGDHKFNLKEAFDEGYHFFPETRP